MEKVRVKVGTVAAILFWLPLVLGHGRLVEPPARGTMFRYGFSTPANYGDNQLFCGGFQNQWKKNNGACGVCGDPVQGPYDNEAGGKYATDTIARCYPSGTTSIEIKSEVTANHLGFFEYRLCEHNNTKTRFCRIVWMRTFSRKPSQDKLSGDITQVTALLTSPSITVDNAVTQITTSPTFTSNTVDSAVGHAANSWGCVGGDCCKGCGPQEEFYGCADIAILPDCGQIPLGIVATDSGTGQDTSNPAVPGGDKGENEPDVGYVEPAKPQETWPNEPETPQDRPKVEPETPQDTQKVGPEEPPHVDQEAVSCRPIGVFATIGGMQKWCTRNCGSGQPSCPASICTCEPIRPTTLPPWVPITVCRSAGAWKGQAGIDNWCKTVCNHNPPYCPKSHCICEVIY
ncbi:hypothetical protein ScPMuIL_012821 [Solemya velum]